MDRSRQDHVDVRFLRTDAFADPLVAARSERLLGADERRALARLRQPAARRDYLAAHALARTMLAERLGVDTARIRLYTPRWGRPQLLEPASPVSLKFSLSHSDGVCLCAIASGCEVGADIESLRNLGPDTLQLAETVCSPREKRELRSLADPARAWRLLSIWTFKEAVTKALGCGVRFPFGRLTVLHAIDGRRRVEIETARGGVLFPGSLMCLRVSPLHVAAIAVLGSPLREGWIPVDGGSRPSEDLRMRFPSAESSTTMAFSFEEVRADCFAG